MATSNVPPRVAVLGGGIAGCAAAAALLRAGGDKLQVTLLEMGRGVGGRATTRGTRDDRRIAVNHGAPFAEVETEQGNAFFRDLADRGFAAQFDGPSYSLGLDTEDGSPSLEPTCVPSSISRWHGVPKMSRLCDGLLAASQQQPSLCFGKMVQSIEPLISESAVTGWRLQNKDGEIVCECDWLMISASGVVHPRWTRTFGGEPPLKRAADFLGNSQLSAAVSTIAAMGARPVQVALMAFEGRSAAAWRKLPFRVAQVNGDAALSKIIVQEGAPDDDVVFVVLHSTRAFAEGAVDVHGSTSTAARVGGAANSGDREQQVLEQLLDAMRRALVGGDLLEAEYATHDAAIFGPHLHRWGNAFSEGAPLELEQALCAEARIAFCGDFVGARTGSIEGAMLSGSTMGKLVAELI